MTRMPPPRKFTPIGEIARGELPDERPRQQPKHVMIYPEDREAARDIVLREHPQLTITADITIPITAHFAKRLTALLSELREEIEEQAPWLANVKLDVHR